MTERTKKLAITQSLKVNLTDEEVLTLSKEMAKSQADIDEAERRKREITAQIKAEIEALTQAASIAGEKIRNGYEYRPVKCEKLLDFDSLRATITRLDTGEIVTERALRDDELQMQLPAGQSSPAA